MWFQSPEYFEWSRMFLLPTYTAKEISALLRLSEKSVVLDVGCGSGELVKFLSGIVPCNYTGVDIDQALISYAEKHNGSPSCHFLCANAYRLPFDDNSFDVVVSHTFLTAVFDVETAMREMQRVCKPGGIVASISPESLLSSPFESGSYKECSWLLEYRHLKTELDDLYMQVGLKQSVGLAPEEIPAFFAGMGFERIAVSTVGRFFSLSNCNIDAQERRKYIEAEYAAELTRLSLLPESIQPRYKTLLGKHMDLLMKQGAASWEWNGGAILVVIGENAGKHFSCKQPVHDYPVLPEIKEEHTIEFIRSGVGSFSSVAISVPKRSCYVVGVGTTPCLATQAASINYQSYCMSSIPDEVNMDKALLLHDNDLLVSSLQQLYPPEASDFHPEEYLAQWGETFDVIKFTRLGVQHEQFFPLNIFQWCYGGIGFGTGSDRQEAVISGLFEIVSLHQLKEIYRGKLVPRRLNIDLCDFSDECKALLEGLQIDGRQMFVFDISGDFSIPIIATMISRNGRCCIKAAAATNVGLALEHTLLLHISGKHIDSLPGIDDVVCKQASLVGEYNFLHNGTGAIPASFFQAIEKCCDISEIKPIDCVDVLSLFYEQNWDIYVRDISVREGCAVQVISPAVGLLYSSGHRRAIEYRLHRWFEELCKAPGQLANEEIQRLIQYLELILNYHNDQITKLPVQAFLFGAPVNSQLLLSMCLIKTGEYAKAGRLLPSHNEAFRCLRKYLELPDWNYIGSLYSKDIVVRVKETVAEPLKLFWSTSI